MQHRYSTPILNLMQLKSKVNIERQEQRKEGRKEGRNLKIQSAADKSPGCGDPSSLEAVLSSFRSEKQKAENRSHTVGINRNVWLASSHHQQLYHELFQVVLLALIKSEVPMNSRRKLQQR